MTERWNPLFALGQEHPKHVSLMTAQTSIVEDETNHDRTERPVVCRDANHEQSMSNEVDIDFTVPGLPHFVVKEAENYRVRELVKKIENHRHRRSLQRDLQQNKAYNPFSTTATKMIEMKKSVSKWTILRTRISLITWQRIFSIQTELVDLSH